MCVGWGMGVVACLYLGGLVWGDFDMFSVGDKWWFGVFGTNRERQRSII